MNYRGYTVQPCPYGWEAVHEDYDGPGDPRCFVEETHGPEGLVEILIGIDDFEIEEDDAWEFHLELAGDGPESVVPRAEHQHWAEGLVP